MVSTVDETYTIGRLAERAEVPISTVRYYEQRGLLKPEGRTSSNYRLYGPESLKRLRFVRIAQTSGFTLEDIVLLLQLRDGTGDSCGEVEGVIAQRLERIRRHLKDLRRIEKVLGSALDWCRNPRVKGRCRVLDDLDERSVTSQKSRRRAKAGKAS